MLTMKARYFIDLGAQFHDLSLLYYSRSLANGEPLSAQERGGVQEHLERVYVLCSELRLSTARELIRTRTDHDRLPRTAGEFEILKDAVYAELGDKYFVYIPSERLEYYDTSKIVSKRVRDAFPSADKELRSAGNCYALGLATASVFHSMRAVELAIQVMANALEVQFSYPINLAEMGKLIEACEEAIQKLKEGPRSVQKDADLKFYSEAAAQFRHFNNGWRIRVSHARESYEDAQAKDVLDHVRAFFETLATRLKEF